jgi:hypothetical protein
MDKEDIVIRLRDIRTTHGDASEAADVVEALRATVSRYADAISEMYRAGVMGCRCDRDDVIPGQCFMCLLLFADEEECV